MESKHDCSVEPKSVTTVIVHAANVEMKKSRMKPLFKVETQLVEQKLEATIASNRCQKINMKFVGGSGMKSNETFKNNPDVAPLKNNLFSRSVDVKEYVDLPTCSVVLKRIEVKEEDNLQLVAKQRRYVF